MTQNLICMNSLTSEVPSENATKMCVIHYDFIKVSSYQINSY